MMPHATLWLFAVALGTLAAIARVRNTAVTFCRPNVVILMLAALVMIVVGEVREAPVAIGVALVLACVIVCAATDLATGLIFDAVTAASILMILLFAFATKSLTMSILGACVCAGSLLALYVATRRRGIGLGDVKLGAVIGAGCGAELGIGAIGSAFVVGALWAAPLLLSGRALASDRVVFAPCLALGTLGFLAFASLHGHG
jgi:prepilin signal peptidase PulO-like enzyme (type II secretory pathway)